MNEAYNMWLEENKKFFSEDDIPKIQTYLEKMDDKQFEILCSAKFKNPNVTFALSFLGMDRFYLDEVLLGVIKLLTECGLLIWLFIDIFSAKKRTYECNMEKLLVIVNLIEQPTTSKLNDEQKKAIAKGAIEIGKTFVKGAKDMNNSMYLD